MSLWAKLLSYGETVLGQLLPKPKFNTRRGEFSSGTIVLPSIPKTDPNLDPKPNPSRGGGLFSSEENPNLDPKPPPVRIPGKAHIFLSFIDQFRRT